ncbi:MAG: tRNA-dihydrouridine synthase, partial [Desulfuromonadales bacterium]|nr:tRNA-dihydrouridine synthase [Desulfuromonadales bacterium]
TAQVVKQSSLPVIANGDIRSAQAGRRILNQSGAAGLMLGRGAINDPLLFARLRDPSMPEPTPTQQAATLQRYMLDLLPRYQELFCGDVQILNKLKNVLFFVAAPALAEPVTRLKRCKTLKEFIPIIDRLA